MRGGGAVPPAPPSDGAPRRYGDVLPSARRGERMVVLQQPVGVCALVTPWNFPLAMITRKAGAALAAGCTAVVKPAEDTPLTAEAFVAVAAAAGLPEGVLELVTCSRESVAEVGAVLATHPDVPPLPHPASGAAAQPPQVRKLSFTGSTAVGKHLAALAVGARPPPHCAALLPMRAAGGDDEARVDGAGRQCALCGV